MNLSYRTRRFLQGLGIAAMVLTLLGLIFSLVWMLWLDRYVVYSRDGAKFDFSLSSQDISGAEAVKPVVPDVNIVIGEGNRQEEVSLELVQLSGYYADVGMLEKEFDLVLQQAANIRSGTPVMLDVKDIYGYFLYNTSVGTYQSKSVNTSQVTDLINYLDAQGAYLIARLPAFKDQRYGLDNVPYGLHHESNRYLYMDEDNCYWLSPNSDGTMNYLVEITMELKKMGFDEVVYDYFWYPDANNLAFKGNREESISKAAARLVESCATESFAVSFVAQEPDFDLPEGRTRMYLTGRSASNAATLAAETGLDEDVKIRLVFIADGNDTRFDAYGALRPLTAARFEDEED